MDDVFGSVPDWEICRTWYETFSLACPPLLLPFRRLGLRPVPRRDILQLHWCARGKIETVGESRRE